MILYKKGAVILCSVCKDKIALVNHDVERGQALSASVLTGIQRPIVTQMLADCNKCGDNWGVKVISGNALIDE